MPLPMKKSKPLVNFKDYTTFWYGPPKIGKSSLFKHEDYLYFGFEKGLKALSVYRRYPKTWEEFDTLLTELSQYVEKGGKRYKGIVIDTAEKFAIRCMKHVCDEMGIDHPADAPYGKGWDGYRRELESAMIRLEDIPLPKAWISHSQIVSIFSKNKEKSRISPKLSGIPRAVILSQVDAIIYVGYSPTDEETRVLQLRGTGLIEAGGRWEEVFDLPKRIKYRQSAAGQNYGLSDLAKAIKLKGVPDESVSKTEKV